MEFTSPAAQARYEAFVRAAHGAVIALDFDGTLSPIVEDPTLAHIHPDAGDVLVDLAEHVRALAVITGRPARKVLDLGGLEEVGVRLEEHGKDLFVFGQYGNERWSTRDHRVISPRPPAGMAGFLRDLPGMLRDHDLADAYLEEKGLAVAVHTRRLPDPATAFARLLGPATELATEHGLDVEPGRNVLEFRGHGMDKGKSVHTLAEEVAASAFMFAGDDLGDLAAYDAVGELAAGQMPTLLVCSAPEEESALAESADVVVQGPEGVLDLLRQLTADAAAAAV